MRRHSIAGALVLLFCLGTSVAAQPENHIGEPLAQVMIAAGCTLSEAEAATRLDQKGYGPGDLQAQAMALLNGRFLGSTGDGQWRLQGWPPCT